MVADPKKDSASSAEQAGPTAADLLAELAKARAEIAALKAGAASAAANPPASNFSNATEIDAGIDDKGVQWWWHKIDLAPVGGTEIKVNGLPYYHGEQYRVTTDTLRSLKDMEFRTWKHEDDISGSNENFYRPQTAAVFSGKVNGRIR